MTAITPAAAAREHTPDRPAPGLVAAVRAEWTKLWSLRSTSVMIALTLVIGAGMSALVSLAVGAAGAEALPEGVDLNAQALAMAQVGPFFSLIVLIVLAAGASAWEYSTGLIRLTLGVHPRRWRPLVAKAVVLTGIVLAVGLATAAAAFLASQAVLSAYDIPSLRLGDDGALRAVLLLAATFPVFPLLALALGSLLRSTASAITSAIALMWLPAIFGALLPAWTQKNILRYFPGTASDNVVGIGSDVLPTYMAPWPAAAVVVAWLAAALGAALWTLARRDA